MMVNLMMMIMLIGGLFSVVAMVIEVIGGVLQHRGAVIRFCHRHLVRGLRGLGRIGRRMGL